MHKTDNTYQYQRIKELLKDEINALPPNAKLLSRPELAVKYQTSRTTIDKAISELIGEGYLYAINGSGTYIAERESTLNESVTSNNYLSWGVILPDIRQDTYPGILRGIEDEANANGINTIICNSDNDDKKESEYLYKMIRSKVSGIIIVPAVIAAESSIEAYRAVAEAGIPLVFCNRGVPYFDAPKVVSNNFYGGYLVTKHLLESGYKRIGYITRLWYVTSMERFQGYLSALSEYGIEIDENLYTFPVDPQGRVDEIAHTQALMQSATPPDALFCFNDSIAEKVFDEVCKSGKIPGADFGLAGYDNTNICDKLPIKLTSVKFKTYEIGREAAKLILRITHGEYVPKYKSIILQPQLVIRESSGKKDTR